MAFKMIRFLIGTLCSFAHFVNCTLNIASFPHIKWRVVWKLSVILNLNAERFFCLKVKSTKNRQKIEWILIFSRASAWAAGHFCQLFRRKCLKMAFPSSGGTCQFVTHISHSAHNWGLVCFRMLSKWNCCWKWWHFVINWMDVVPILHIMMDFPWPTICNA